MKKSEKKIRAEERQRCKKAIQDKLPGCPRTNDGYMIRSGIQVALQALEDLSEMPSDVPNTV